MPNHPHHGRGLGWKPGKGTNPAKYPMRAVLQAAPPVTVVRRAWWPGGAWLDQGSTSQCTIYSWAHLLADGPLTQTALVKSFGPDGLTRLYEEGQQIDGTPVWQRDSGLTTDAAAQVMKRHGFIGAYHWAASAAEVIAAILALGPVTLGLDWREPMFTPDPKTARVRYTGAVAGGHQVVLDGVDTVRRLVRLKNSWGREYGRRGFAFLTFDDLDAIMRNGGEACVATEVRAHA